MDVFEKVDNPSAYIDYRRITGTEAYRMDMEITFAGGKKIEAQYGGYTVKTDQPIPDGGSGTAPSPFDLFLASIGTCAGYYVLSFCQKNNIPTKNLTLSASIDWNQKNHLVEHFDITINVPVDFPEKYINAVIKVADVCTVKRHLQNPPKIDIKLIRR